MIFDKKLTQAWFNYFENNCDWDDYENHGGGDPKKPAKACQLLETQVKAHYGTRTAAKMVKWAQRAYERVYYERGPSASSLKRSLPPEVDPKVFDFLPKSALEIQANRRAQDIKTLKSLARKLGFTLAPLLNKDSES